MKAAVATMPLGGADSSHSSCGSAAVQHVWQRLADWHPVSLHYVIFGIDIVSILLHATLSPMLQMSEPGAPQSPHINLNRTFLVQGMQKPSEVLEIIPSIVIF